MMSSDTLCINNMSLLVGNFPRCVCLLSTCMYNSTLNILWANMALGQPLQKLQNPSTPMRHEGIFLWRSQEHQEKVILCRCMYKNYSLNKTVTLNSRSSQTVYCQLFMPFANRIVISWEYIICGNSTRLWSREKVLHLARKGNEYEVLFSFSHIMWWACSPFPSTHDVASLKTLHRKKTVTKSQRT